MKKNAKIVVISLLCAVVMLLSVCLSSCSSLSAMAAKKKIAQIKGMAEQGVQWMPEHCSSVIYKTSNTDNDEKKSTEKTTTVTVSPTYTWYHKSIYTSESSDQDESNETVCFLSIIVSGDKVYGGIAYGPKEDVGQNKLAQYKIVGANSESFIEFAKSLVREYNSKVNDTVKELLNDEKSVQKEYSSEADDAETESYIADGTLYGMTCINEDALICNLSVGIQNDNDTVYTLCTQKLGLHDNETLLLRGNNGFEETTKSGKIEEELETIALEDFLKQAETLSSDSEISNALQSIK